MSYRLICERCGRGFDTPPARDYYDGGWYCSCGGDVIDNEDEEDDNEYC